jgi:hypothetical protein
MTQPDTLMMIARKKYMGVEVRGMRRALAR